MFGVVFHNSASYIHVCHRTDKLDLVVLIPGCLWLTAGAPEFTAVGAWYDSTPPISVGTPCSNFTISIEPPSGIVANLNGTDNTTLFVYTAAQSAIPFTFAASFAPGPLTLDMVLDVSRCKSFDEHFVPFYVDVATLCFGIVEIICLATCGQIHCVFYVCCRASRLYLH
jgi:hypothetical protein